MQTSGVYQSVNSCWNLGIRPYCPCCGGSKYRKGYSHSKSKSHKMNRRQKVRFNDNKINKRDRYNARPDKYWIE